ncbi:MAG: hypothetical protein IKE65_06575 [Clostridia bacterium]|nr:hypothetical protein [Clostridia bacterium]
MNDIHKLEDENSGTMQFSLSKTKHVNIKKPAKKIDVLSQKEKQKELDELKMEEELLKNQVTPTEFEDVFSDEEKQEEEAVTESVVSVEEVFKQSADMINEDFHDGTEEEDTEPSANPKLRKAAIILGIISGIIVLLAAIAIGIIIIF